MLVPRTQPVTFDPNAMTSIDLTPMAPAPAPGIADTVGAALRQENALVSIMSHHSAGGDQTPGYNAWDDIAGTEFEPLWDKFTASGNAGQTAALKRQITQEVADRNTLAAAGGWGMLASLGAGIFSPESLLPGGTVVRGARAGTAIARTALATAGATALGTSLAEIGLMGSQVTRTPTEAAINIGGSALLGGMLGAGVSAVFTRADFARLSQQFSDEALAATDPDILAANEAAMFSGMLSPASAGAAARPVATLEENSIAGRAASVVGAATAQLNPVLRALHSPSAVMRDVATKLFENPLYLKRNMSGDTAGPAVESLVRQYNQGAMASGIEQANAIYGDFRKAGGQLDRSGFNQAVGAAMRRGDEGGDPMVTKAAQAWRSTVFEPLKEAAIKAGLLPADVSVDTALSYFSRVYNRTKIEAREIEFKGIVRQYIGQEVRNAEIKLEVSKLDPRYDAPTKPAPEFLTDADRASYVDEIVNDVFDTITGRNIDGDMPLNIVASKRGPLKERTFSIPDHMIEDFLESDVEAVARRYSRVMAADVELTNMFGKADMSEQIAQIRENYQQLRQAIAAGGAPPAGGKPMGPAQIEAALKKLAAGEKADIRDLQALRDMIRGSYLARENSTNFARTARVAGTLNYLRTMGGVTLSSVTDISRHVMVHGLSNVMRDGLVPLISNLKSFKMSVHEAKLAGAVTERLLNTRMATWSDIADPYSMASPFERFMENTANGFSRVNGMVYWNDFQKSFASVLTQSRILRNASLAIEARGKSGKLQQAAPPQAGHTRYYYGAYDPDFDVAANDEMWVTPTIDYARNYRSLGGDNTLWFVDVPDAERVGLGIRDDINGYNINGKLPAEWAAKARRLLTLAPSAGSSGRYASLPKSERAYMAYLGIDGSMAERIARQFEAHGSIEDGGVRVAGSDAWDDDYARRVYRAAVGKDVSTTIIDKGVGDVPLFMKTPLGSMVMQFKGFALASHQRALMRGLQERPMGFVSGTMVATTMGMMVYWLKAAEANRLDSISDNPGVWIAEGLDRSGVLTVAFEANNTIEKAFGIGAYGALASAFPNADGGGKASRYLNRGISETIVGPTGALLDNLVAAGNAIKPDGKWTQADINSIKRLLPGATLPGIRSLVEYLGMPAVEQAIGVE